MPKPKKSSDPAQVLHKLHDLALSGTTRQIDDDLRKWIGAVVDNSERQKGVLAMLISLLLKKVVSPKQDIRYHQTGMRGGFSARGFDAKYVTPFLKETGFPYMISGSGALTRSLEQARPYNLNYPGKIRSVKTEFLSIVDAVQTKNKNAKDVLVWLLFELVDKRQQRQNIELIRPRNKHIREVIEKLDKHFQKSGRGSARLPVLAIYAVYRQLTTQMRKYEGCSLCDLQAHQSADSRSGALGDIQVNKKDRTPFEVVEIKHGITLTPDLTMDCYRKFQSSQVETYYLLSTREELSDSKAISDLVRKIQTEHGCQMIVNGIITTLRYYLRLIKSTDRFVNDYANLVDKEGSIAIKEAWNNLWAN